MLVDLSIDQAAALLYAIGVAQDEGIWPGDPVVDRLEYGPPSEEDAAALVNNLRAVALSYEEAK